MSDNNIKHNPRLASLSHNDVKLRMLFLTLWSSATESPSYDSHKWNEFRDLLIDKNIFV